MNIINEHGFRADGRRSHQIRNINCRLGVYPQAEGSAYIEQGNTKILCAVYGPHEGKRSWQKEDRCVINCQFSSTTFSGLDRKSRPRGDRKSTEFARLLSKTFESAIITQSFPRAQIDIFCEVIQADGSQLAACVNAASLALADAGIPMRGLVAAVTCGSISGVPVIDVNSREETDLLPRITMFRSVARFRSIGAFSLRTFGGTASCASQAAPQQKAEFDGFENLIKEVKQQVITTGLQANKVNELGYFTSVKSINQFIESKDTLSASDLMEIMGSACSLKLSSDVSKEIADRCFSLSQNVSLKPAEVLTLMTLLMRLELQEKTEFFKSLENKWEENLSSVTSDSIPFSTLLSFICEASERKYSLSKPTYAAFEKIIDTQIGNISKTSDLLTLLNHYKSPLSNKWLVSAAEKAKTLLPIMSLNEFVSVFKCFAAHGKRDTPLLRLIAQRIVESKTPLSVRQIVVVASSSASLNFLDVRIPRRLISDLQVNVNHLDSWNDVTSLISSFSRLRVGDQDVHRILIQWVNNHLSTAPLQQLSIVVAALAKLGIEDGRVAAAELARRVKRDKAASQKVWLNIVHSLAFFEELPMSLGETVLNKDFVKELMVSSKSLDEKVYNAMRVLSVQSFMNSKFGDEYKGARVDRDSFGIQLDSQEVIEAAFRSKYGGKRVEEVKDLIFKNGLLKIAPSTHIGPALIDNSGCLVEACVIMDENSRLVSNSLWKDHYMTPRPILFFTWNQKHQRLSDVSSDPESGLLGPEKLSLRLLRKEGANPIVIFDNQLIGCSTQADKNAFISKKLSSTS